MSDAAAPLQQQIIVRPAEDSADFGVGVGLQRTVWGYSEIDTVPDQMFVVAKKTGGQVLLAFDGKRAVGFALAFVALKETGAYLHSHMVGVLAEYRDRGVGRLLKLAQRQDALTRRIDRIEWTFDPLQLKNARFNIARLGTVVRHYLPNLYGRTSSPLHAGLPTDRLVAEWWLDSSRVRARVGKPAARAAKKSTGKKKLARIRIPGELAEFRCSQPEEAAGLQSEIRLEFEHWFGRGYAATGIEIDTTGSTYILESWKSDD